MANKFGRYVWLIEQFRQYGRLTFEEISRHWVDSGLSYELTLPELQWDCSLRRARQIYDYGCHTLAYLCEQLSIPEGRHHRAGDDAEMCARLYLRELHDSNLDN